MKREKENKKRQFKKELIFRHKVRVTYHITKEITSVLRNLKTLLFGDMFHII
jgi:hypothetical protein